MAKEGAHSAEIAAALGRTKHSVVAKASALRVFMPGSHVNAAPALPRKCAHGCATYLSLWKGVISTAPPPIKFEQVLREVADKHGLSVAELRGSCRMRGVAWPRQEVMYRAYRETRLSLPQIGSRLGDRDHTTVLYGIKAHAGRIGLEA